VLCTRPEKEFLYRRRDMSFDDYLRLSHHPPAVRNWVRVHIEGFNAARAESISASSLARDNEAAGKIEGDRTFRIIGGYDSVVTSLLRSIPDCQSVLWLNSVVKKVTWRAPFVCMTNPRWIANPPCCTVASSS
jgi:hypothetical protein